MPSYDSTSGSAPASYLAERIGRLGSGRSLLEPALTAEFSRRSGAGAWGGARCTGGEPEGRAELESGRSLLDVALSAELARDKTAGGAAAPTASGDTEPVAVAARAALRASNSRRRSSSASRCDAVDEAAERALDCIICAGRSLLAGAISAEFSRVSIDGGCDESREGIVARPARLESGRSLLDVALSAEF